MKGKIIYQTTGSASEYAKYGFSAYLGCSVGCHYCYNKKGRFAKVLGGNVPTLKKCFKDESHALEVFEKELMANLPELQKHGLFFTFTSDPCLDSTYELTFKAIWRAAMENVRSKILTKMSGFADHIISVHKKNSILLLPDYWAFGFTLTGCDSAEPNASTNAERIEAMRKLHEAGFRVWASIEPIIDFYSSEKMIDDAETAGCDLFKIGLLSGKKYDKEELRRFVFFISNVCASKIYFKDGLIKQAGILREDLPANCVGRNFKIWEL